MSDRDFNYFRTLQFGEKKNFYQWIAIDAK